MTEEKKKSGTRFALFGCGGCLALMFGLMVIGALSTASMDDPSNVQRAPTAPAVVPEVPAAPSVPVPASQQAFCDAVQGAKTAYKDAMRAKANELKLSKIRTSRARAVVAAGGARGIRKTAEIVEECRRWRGCRGGAARDTEGCFGCGFRGWVSLVCPHEAAEPLRRRAVGGCRRVASVTSASEEVVWTTRI